MRNRVPKLGGLLLILAVVVLSGGCGGSTPATVVPSPTPSSFDTSVLPTPSFSTSVLPTPPVTDVHGKVLLLFGSLDSPAQSTLATSDPDGRNRQVLSEVAPDPLSVAVSPNGQYLAYFTSAPTDDGLLVVQDVLEGETVFQTMVPAEQSSSFRDASPVRYLTWSPDSQGLAAVMSRDLHLVNIPQQTLQTLAEHREDQYSMAGLVMGSIKRPTWSADGGGIVYDAWSPPDILSESADAIRDVEYVDVSTGMTELLVEGARIVYQTAHNEQGLILQRQDGTFVELDLASLEIWDTAPAPETEAPALCDRQGRRCVAILSEQGERDVVRLETLPGGTKVDEVRLADLGESASDCQFQSVLWRPDGEALLATVGCGGQVSLWSIGVPDLVTSRLIDWPDVNHVVLLYWFE